MWLKIRRYTLPMFLTEREKEKLLIVVASLTWRGGAWIAV